MNEPADASEVAGALAGDLARWNPASSEQAKLRDEYLAFIAEGGSSVLDRDGGRSHLTASCFVFNPDLTRILLCFHTKGQFWVQLGGHIERTDPSVPSAAFREAAEEGGITVVPVSEHPVDVDRHALGSGFQRCDTHWDIGYAAVAPEGSQPVTSEESDDVRWWPVDELPAEQAHGLASRIDLILRGLPTIQQEAANLT